uniref:Uncharacterized protein n=1 Tax=Arundo donax TaxID=35708 RepID=A0A0A9GCE8_ARUDO
MKGILLLDLRRVDNREVLYLHEIVELGEHLKHELS